MTVTIIKCGGSLLNLPDLPHRLLALLDAESLTAALVLVGGGAAVDVVRDWDRQHAMAAEDAHELAICAMTLNARLLISAHERFCGVTSFDQAAELPHASVAVLIADVAIRQLETQHAGLPRSWSVTSDAIAAWLATIHDTNLLMLKSVGLPTDSTSRSVAALAEAGLVDSCFPEYAVAVPSIKWCNLRDAPASIQPVAQ